MILLYLFTNLMFFKGGHVRSVRIILGGENEELI